MAHIVPGTLVQKIIGTNKGTKKETKKERRQKRKNKN
jgi:hypothetical protein